MGRNDQIIALARQLTPKGRYAHNLCDIAARFNINHSRVSQIIRDAGLPSRKFGGRHNMTRRYALTAQKRF